MDIQEWDPERVSPELRNPVAAAPLDDGVTAALAARALFLLGRGHVELQPDFASFYPGFVERVSVPTRRYAIFPARASCCSRR